VSIKVSVYVRLSVLICFLFHVNCFLEQDISQKPMKVAKELTFSLYCITIKSLHAVPIAGLGDDG